jgi:GT2 family glycosyltransferase/glycosyltransferase involved in cell wall biosynthesis
MPPIDIIVPVSRGLEATRRCLESAIASTEQSACEIVVVNDASPEPEVARYVRDLADRQRVTLITQPSRQGYAAAINRALALHRDRDVVVLQSDAEVANDWLERLARHAQDERVGVVGTYTNAVGLATYPRAHTVNPIPAGETVASLDARFAAANANASVQFPAVRGPCLYVRRECIAAVGAFDSGPLGSDYGVETDFCLRAGSAGFRHLLAGDVFVGHSGYESFGAAQADELAGRTELALHKLYPGYAAVQQAVRERDAARVFARRVDLSRIADSPRPLIVFVSHPWGGGIRRYMNDLAALIADRAEVLYLEPAVGDTVKLYWPREGEGFSMYFRLPGELPVLADVLRAIRVARLHFHHVHKLPRAILDLPSAVGVPFDCTLHDYFAICPQYHLVTEAGRYCGEPDALGCAACLTRRPGQWGLDITSWRGAFGRFLAAADRLIAPSQDVASRLARYFPDLAIQVWPHPESTQGAPQRIARVVIVGNLSPEKGLHVVAQCARDARARSLPLMFRVLGSTTEPIPQAPEVPLSIHGQYEDASLPALLAAEKADVILFPAQVPETYAYTLSVALGTDTPIVASALGAFPERLAGRARSSTIPWNAPASQWNAALLQAAGMTERPVPTFTSVPLKAVVP